MNRSNDNSLSWHQYGQPQKGTIGVRSRDKQDCLVIENITGKGGWESEPVAVVPHASYVASWSTKAIGPGGYTLAPSRDDCENKVANYLAKMFPGNPEARRFLWPHATDFIGLELIFITAKGDKISSQRYPMSVESYIGLVGTKQWEQYTASREDLTAFQVPAWIEFTPPSGAAAVILRFIIESRADICAGIAVSECRLLRRDSMPPPGPGLCRIVIDAIDAGTREPVSARVSVIDQHGNYHFPPYCIQNQLPVPHFYLLAGATALDLPVGCYFIEAIHGFEYEKVKARVSHVPEGETEHVCFELHCPLDMRQKSWYCGDHHLHISGHTIVDYPLLGQEAAMDMGETDGMSFFPLQMDPFAYYKSPGVFVSKRGSVGQACMEFVNFIWGHYCSIGGEEPYPGEFATTTLFPSMYDVIKHVDCHHGACVAAHPTQTISSPCNTVSEQYYLNQAILDVNRFNCARELPLILLLGEPCGFDLMIADGQGIQQMAIREYYRLLDFGFRVAACGSSDTGINSRRSKAHTCRTYVQADSLNMREIASGYQHGHTFATNGPVISFAVNNKMPGDILVIDKNAEIDITVEVFSPWGLSFVELIYNGRPVARKEISGHNYSVCKFDLPAHAAGWLAGVVRGPGNAWIESGMMPEEERLMYGQMAHTTPVFIRFPDQPLLPESAIAGYYRQWLQNLLHVAEYYRDRVLARDAERAGVGFAEAWDIIAGRIAQGLRRIDAIESNGWN